MSKVKQLKQSNQFCNLPLIYMEAILAILKNYRIQFLIK